MRPNFSRALVAACIPSRARSIFGGGLAFVAVFSMTMGEEAQRLFMTMIKESPLPAASAVIDALATPENVGEIPDENTAASDVGERGQQPAPEVKRGGGGSAFRHSKRTCRTVSLSPHLPQVGGSLPVSRK
ncbi:uncharacterized protein LOC142577964 [Dermacentor variabilis]|uniref:uncharacterized protein LOC142577964 n=1 Tax=Dermacentor variabilis TaxID=34621 RepID=UPI003F5B7AF9